MNPLQALKKLATRLAPGRWSPATRVASGLAALMVTLILVADLFTGALPDRLQEARRYRTATGTLVASQVASALRAGRLAELPAVLGSALQHEPQLVSAAVRLANGETAASAGDHAQRWKLQPADRSTTDNLRTALLSGGKPWGELQLAFEPALPAGPGGWLRDPLVLWLLLVSVLGFGAFQLYLRRVLHYMDPNAAVPERVRAALDTLTEGVLVLDPRGNIMLANRTFLALAPPGSRTLSGLAAASLPWLVAGLPAGAAMPWLEAVRERRAVTGLRLQVETAEAGARQLILNCSPIDDGAGRVRGCLASFSDVTELHEQTERLRVTLGELGASQREIEAKNRELMHQSSRDPLTGCLNRRALMQEADQRFAELHAGAGPISFVMCDIDHFKSINDQFGHASGDLVIQSVVKSLSRGLRIGDVLGRYGGEEFCILLPDTSAAQALDVAERLRAEVDATVGANLRQPSRPRVTMSFGVAQWEAGIDSATTLIDLADQALYHSKNNGRNKVTAYQALAGREAKAEIA